MAKLLATALLLSLIGCAAQAPVRADESPCAAGEATYACQVERYNNVNAD